MDQVLLKRVLAHHKQLHCFLGGEEQIKENLTTEIIDITGEYSSILDIMEYVLCCIYKKNPPSLKEKTCIYKTFQHALLDYFYESYDEKFTLRLLNIHADISNEELHDFLEALSYSVIDHDMVGICLEVRMTKDILRKYLDYTREIKAKNKTFNQKFDYILKRIKNIQVL